MASCHGIFYRYAPFCLRLAQTRETNHPRPGHADPHRLGSLRSDGPSPSNEGPIPPDEPRDLSHLLEDHADASGRGEADVGAVRVMVIDDMTLVRQGIESLLRKKNSVEIVGEVSDVQEALNTLAQVDPDVVLLDQDMPGLATPEAVSLLKQQRPQTEIIVLSEAPDEERAFRALEAGASGYVLKDISPDNLVRAIHGVCDGRTMTHPYITRRLIERFRILMQERKGQNGIHLAGLTNRELGIVVEMAEGATDREIAKKACLGESTVKSHIRSILRKIGARNRTQAVAYLLRKGIMR